MDYERLGAFYLGTGDAGEVVLDAKDLTTHAVCVGMTGSGKTGLCVGLLEEALLDGIPVIAIDPKGDLANLALTFPAMTPADVAPWVEAGQADAIAQRWKDGLAATGQPLDRIARLRAAGDVVIYTPGSDAGVPLAALRSLRAPTAAVLDDDETYRDRVESAARGLLTLIGEPADPLRSREHVLVARLLDLAWRAGEDVALATLIQRITRPPFDTVGAFDLETFFPAKDRTTLALALNTLLASPSAEAWAKGDPLEIASLLYGPNGRPRIAVLSIAHLDDAARMFFVTTLLTELVSWMRGQPGTSSLRALVFMDEVTGYLPPVAAPPSKKPFMTLFKQARAFGVGVVVATQNPVDLDYKALSNAGTWFLGRLQTERDQEKVLDGLASARGTFDKAATAALLSSLPPRSFVLSSAHDDHAITFKTRQTLSLLAGPLTRAQLKQLRAAPASASASVTSPSVSSAARPIVPPALPELFTSGTSLSPHLLVTAKLHHVDARRSVDVWRDVTVLAPLTADTSGDFFTAATLLTSPPATLPSAPPSATYAPLPRQALDPKKLPAQAAAFLFRAAPLRLQFAPDLKLSQAPIESAEAFQARLALARRESRDAAIDKLRAKARPRLDALAAKLRTAEDRVAREQAQASAATADSAISIGASVLGALFGGRRTSASKVVSAARSVGRTATQRGDVARATAAATELQSQLADLESDLEADVLALDATPPAALETLELPPRKDDTVISGISLLWGEGP